MTNTHHFVDRIAPDLARCWLLVLQRDVIEATTDQVKAIHAAAQREVLRQLIVIQIVAGNQKQVAVTCQNTTKSRSQNKVV